MELNYNILLMYKPDRKQWFCTCSMEFQFCGLHASNLISIVVKSDLISLAGSS